MNKRVDYYFSLNSPWTYLGSRRVEKICADAGAKLHPMPVEFGVIFAQSGGLPLAKRAPPRQAYRMMELKRWREFLGVPLNLEPKFFPAAERQAALATVAARQLYGDSAAVRLAHAILAGVWAEEANIADTPTLERIIASSGRDSAVLLKAAARDDVAQAYAADTEAAMKRGIFGAPTFVYNDELFWGQDRLDFLERALKR